MKKLLFIVCAIAIISCKKEAKPNYAIVSGKILNKPDAELTLLSIDQTIKQPIEISNAGEFTDTLKTNIRFYVIHDGENTVFLDVKDGDDLVINYDANDFKKSLAVTGKGAEITTYFNTIRAIELEFTNLSNPYRLDEDAFMKKFQVIKTVKDSLLKNSKGIPADYVTKELRNLNYSYLKTLSSYEKTHGYFTRNANFKVSEDFLNELKALDYSNLEDYEFSNSYKDLVTFHYTTEAKKLSNKNDIGLVEAFSQVTSKVSNETIKNGMFFDFASRNIESINDIDGLYKSFLKHSTNKKNNEIISEKYTTIVTLYPGQPSPKFSNYKNHNGELTSLDDLKGKYVYIDVWATWCGPCIKEIPALKEVEAKYRDKKIEFVSISIDHAQNFETWKKMVNDKELKGVQLFADNDWNSKFVKDYQIKAIPRFILIDDKGNIIKINAPDPSDPKLIELLTELNI